MTDTRSGPKSRPAPKVVTPAYLDKAALAYLARFATSAANLERVLMRKVDRSAAFHGTDRAVGAALVQALIQRYQAVGLIDDASYARAKTASLHRRGKSAVGITAKLAAKGIDAALIAQTVRGIPADPDDPATDETARPGGDLAAAAALARRKRLGPYGDPAQRQARRLKDLGVFARAGFDRRTAERVLGCPDPAAVATLLEDQE